MTIIEQITNKLNELVGEKFIAEEILNMKYAMEHKDNMDKICNLFENMTCVVLNTVNIEIVENCPIQTHLIFHDKMESNISMDESIESYIFAFQQDEMNQFRYITNIIKNKEEIFLNQEEYMGIYDITLMEESNL